jgi:hypothetical protein
MFNEQQQPPQEAQQPQQQVQAQQPQAQQQPQVGQHPFGQATPQDVDAFYKNIHENVMEELGKVSDNQQISNAQPQPAIQNDPNKVKWMAQYQKLNPGTSTDDAGKTYDHYVKPQEQGTTPIQQQLKAIDAYYKASKPEMVKPEKGKDPDNSEHGYDASDKISALGALMTTGKIGIEDFGARFMQLNKEFGEKFGISPKGAADKFTDWFNQHKAKDKLYQQALNVHPVISAIGETGGQILPQLAIPEGEIAKGIGLAGKGIATAAEKAADYLPTALKDAVEPIATKIGATKLWARVPQLAGTAARAAMISELQYDPSGNNNVNQGLTGAVLGLILHGGGKLVQNLGSKLAPAIKEAADRFGITLPVHPAMERLAQYIPFSGMTSLLKERGKNISDLGSKIGNQILSESGVDDYGSALHGEVLKGFNESKSKVSEMADKIADLAKGGQVKLDNLRQAATEGHLKEAAMPEGLQDEKVMKLANTFANLPDGDYATVNRVRGRIGQILGQYENGFRTGRVSSEQKSLVNNLYGSVMTDMEDFANKKGGEIKKLSDEHNTIYMQKVLPFLKGKYGKYLSANYDTDDFIGGFLKPEHPVKASTLIDLMPEGKEKGLAAARAAILNHALTTSEIPGVGINPEKFINTALRLRSANKVLFSSDQLNTLSGYQKLINLTKKLSPNTLSDNISGHVFRGMFHTGEFSAALWHPHLVLPILGAGNVMARIMNSELGRKTLLKISTLSDKASDKDFLPLLKKTLNIAALNIGSSLSQEQ